MNKRTKRGSFLIVNTKDVFITGFILDPNIEVKMASGKASQHWKNSPETNITWITFH